MTKYKFKAASWILFTLTLIVVLILGIILIADLRINNVLPKGDLIVFFLSFGFIAFIGIYLSLLAAFANVEVTLSENSISIKWLQQFLFDERPDIIISFKEIDEYKNQGDSNWDELKIKLRDAQVYRIWHSKLHTKDDYRKLVSDFVSAIENYNGEVEGVIAEKIITNETPKIIHRAKTIYETKWGIAWGVIIGVAMIAIPISYYFHPPIHHNYIILIPSFAGGIYFIAQIIYYQKKNKS